MATEYPGNIIPAPGYRKGNVSTDDELLNSTVGYTQKGVTLKAGQGVLKPGQILAYETTTKRYVKYASGGSNGTGTPSGFLRTGVDTGVDPLGQEYLGNIVIMGILNLDVISRANSGSIASAVTAFNARTDVNFRTFTF